MRLPFVAAAQRVHTREMSLLSREASQHRDAAKGSASRSPLQVHEIC